MKILFKESDQAASSVDTSVKTDPTPDYLQRLAQAVRSEQGAITEYQAILEEPSLPTDVRSVVSEVMEDEKDHMVLITAVLNKRLQLSFPNNTSELEDLKESIGSKTVLKDDKNSTISDRILEMIYSLDRKSHKLNNLNRKVKDGLLSDISEYISQTASAIRGGDIDSASRLIHDLFYDADTLKEFANELLTLADGIKSLGNTFYTVTNKLVESNSSSAIETLINELKTDTNYDEIAYHINEYGKLDKKRASELMDLLFDLEDNKSPKECRDEIIKHLTKSESIDSGKLNEFFRYNNVEFHIRSDRDTIQITQIHPYDEAEYSWAKSIDGGEQFSIYRAGKFIEQFAPASFEEDEESGIKNFNWNEVARELLRLDKNVEARIDHT